MDDKYWELWKDGKYHHRVEVDGRIYVDGKWVNRPHPLWQFLRWWLPRFIRKVRER